MGKYKIKTVQDIINCTNEKNVDYFLEDLKSYLMTIYTVKALAKHLCSNSGNSDNISNGFTWIDDGKHDIEIKLKPNHKES